MGRDSDVAQLHRLALAVDPDAPIRVGAFDRFVARWLWALISLRQTWEYHRRFSRHVRAQHGISYWRQWRDAWHCMWRLNQCARHYYWRKLFLLPNREAWLDNFEHRETNLLLDHLNAPVPATRITDKVQFAEHCRIHNLPTPKMLAAWQAGGRLVTPVPPDPAGDVFIKPANDYGSVGAMAIAYDPGAGKYLWEERLLSWSELLEEIAAKQAAHNPYVLQKRLRNSAAWSVFGQNDVCNLRLITARTLDGVIEPIAAVIRLPSSFTTQGHDRNVLLATVDVRTGRLGVGLFRNILLPQFTHHPDTKHPLEGWLLPRWSEILELGARAHATCPWMAFIGWDIVDSDQGLVLLEANANWGGDSAQMPGAPGLGRTRFPQIYLEWREYWKTASLAPAGLPHEERRAEANAELRA